MNAKERIEIEISDSERDAQMTALARQLLRAADDIPVGSARLRVLLIARELDYMFGLDNLDDMQVNLRIEECLNNIEKQ